MAEFLLFVLFLMVAYLWIDVFDTKKKAKQARKEAEEAKLELEKTMQKHYRHNK